MLRLLIGLAILVVLGVVAPAWAQPEDLRDLGRRITNLENQVELLRSGQTNLQLNIERRLVVVETLTEQARENSARNTTLLGSVIVALAVQIILSFIRFSGDRRRFPHHTDQEEEHP